MAVSSCNFLAAIICNRPVLLINRRSVLLTTHCTAGKSAAKSLVPVSPDSLKSWHESHMELKLLARFAPHLMAARERVAAMVEIPSQLSRGSVMVPIPVFEDAEPLGHEEYTVDSVLNSKIYLCSNCDLLTLDVDCIVVPASGSLLPHGAGLCGRAHMFGGAVVTEACKTAAPCEIGSVVATPSGHLPSKFILHAVTPRAKADSHLLEPTVQAVLDACVGNGYRTIGLCCLGVADDADIPVPFAVSVLVRLVRRWLTNPAVGDKIDKVVFAAHTARQHEAFEKIMEKVLPTE